MPVIRYWKRHPLYWQLAVISSVLMVLFGAAVISVIALVGQGASNQRAEHASQEAQRAVTCLNSILAKRGPVTARDQAALVHVFHDLGVALPEFNSNPHQAFEDTQNVLIRTAHVLEADQLVRDRNPLGEC